MQQHQAHAEGKRGQNLWILWGCKKQMLRGAIYQSRITEDLKYQSKKNVISALKIAPSAFKTLQSVHSSCLSVRVAVLSLGSAATAETHALW